MAVISAGTADAGSPRWVNQAIGSSIRMYRNAVRYPWVPSHNRQPVVEPPAGFTFLLGDAYPPGVDTVEARIAAFENGPTPQVRHNSAV